MTLLIIARHGNTFSPDETPTRVGKHTDIPLAASGIEQARKIGIYCKNHQLMPDVIFTSQLKRTQQTAQYAFPNIPTQTLSIFDEIDYGPDENKPESFVIERIGQTAIDLWNTQAIVPDGWQVKPEEIIKDWLSFANRITCEHPNKIIFVCTSNGIARFAPYITNHFDDFKSCHELKLKTGSISIFEHKADQWKILSWNVLPTTP